MDLNSASMFNVNSDLWIIVTNWDSKSRV